MTIQEWTFLLIFAWVACVGAPPPPFDPMHGYALCEASTACSKLFSLGEGGSIAAFIKQLTIHGMPAPPDVLVFHFLASPDQGDILTLAELVQDSTSHLFLTRDDRYA